MATNAQEAAFYNGQSVKMARMSRTKSPHPKPNPKDTSPRHSVLGTLGRLTIALVMLGVGAVGALFAVIGLALAVAYPNLPDVDNLIDYKPNLPMRVFSADGKLLGEFGEERRNLVPISEIPPVMINAVLAIEDARFFEHNGVDYRGMVRAGLANLGRARSQGASTITMQVARNVYLSSDKSYMRKIYEVLLTFKLEHRLSKAQILEIYMNQIFLGQRSYGFSTAAQTYFGKSLKDLTIAEAAMLAGLPKAPSAFNPISNPKRATSRQRYIIERMRANGFISTEQARTARAEPLKLRARNDTERVQADFVVDMVRQSIVNQYGEEAYTRGFNVTTTIRSDEQLAAYRAVRAGLFNYEQRQIYRGPERFIQLPKDKAALDDAVDNAIAATPDNGDLFTAVVLSASPAKVVAVRQDGVPFDINREGLQSVQPALSARASPKIKIRPGAVIRVMQNDNKTWFVTQQPEVEAAFVAIDPRTGAIRALVGGFDFQKTQFNHVTQAWRQPGSSFKPFIYSAALEKGVTPSTIINDAPLFYTAAQTGGQPWEPRNYDGEFSGPISLRRALAVSKNMVSIQVLETVGAQKAQDWVTRFGFEAARHPPFLTLALGAGSVTPMQMATGYAVFANGGFWVPPQLISQVDDHRGRVLFKAPKVVLSDQPRAIEERNAFVMNSLLQEITRSGTAARAQRALQRSDLFGKTGTTNDSVDAWFVGYQPNLVAATWVGYGTPRNLGSRETGGGLSLPIWLDFMKTALDQAPVLEYPVPPGVIHIGGEWYFEEFGPATSIRSLGMDDYPATATGELILDGSGNPIQSPSDRERILDLFNQ